MRTCIAIAATTHKSPAWIEPCGALLPALAEAKVVDVAGVVQSRTG